MLPHAHSMRTDTGNGNKAQGNISPYSCRKGMRQHREPTAEEFLGGMEWK